MANAIVYARFSDRKDSQHCQSNEAQLDFCRVYCQQQGHVIVGEFPDDAVSGADEDRPVLWQAIDSLKRDMVLVVYRADRLARNVYLHELIYREVASKRARIEVVDGSRNGDSPEDELVRTILAAFAAFERRIIAARTKAAVLRHQANGIAISKDPPYGKRIGPRRELGGRMRRTLVDDAGEQAIIERVVTMHKSGMGLRAIARVLNEDGVTARGRSWRHALVGKIIGRNEKIAKTAATESRVASADWSGRLFIPADFKKSSPE